MFSDRQVAIGCLASAIAWFVVMAALQQTWAWTMVPAFVVIAAVGFADNRRYAVIGGAMALIWMLVMTVINLPSIGEAIAWAYERSCKGDDCSLQGWLSALSGWVAIAAAYATIRVMNRQTEEMNRHQRENLELELTRRLALARRTEIMCQTAWSYLQHMAEMPGLGRMPAVTLRAQFKVFQATVDLELLQTFSAEIATRSLMAPENIDMRVRMVLNLLEELAASNQPTPGDVEGTNDIAEAILKITREIIQFLSVAHKDAIDFVARWQARIT